MRAYIRVDEENTLLKLRGTAKELRDIIVYTSLTFYVEFKYLVEVGSNEYEFNYHVKCPGVFYTMLILQRNGIPLKSL